MGAVVGLITTKKRHLMHNDNSNIGLSALRHSLLTSAILAAMVPSAHAFEIDTGSEDWAARFDNTVKYNYGVRTESADKRWLGTPNSNDGEYNFRHAGTNITNRVDLLTELDVVFQNSMGFRVSTASWYDKAYENTGSNSNPLPNGNDATSGVGAYGGSHLSHYAQRYYAGPSGEVLDAFVFYNTEVGDESAFSVKVGQHNVYWGETLLSAVHSLSYGQSGLDLAKAAATPGIEAKELFVPRNQISSTFTVNSELTLGAQYFLEWDPARLPEAGTYYGPADVAGSGSRSLLLGYTDPPFSVRRGDHDYEPDDRGDWGVMAKWSPEWLDGTLGFYYRKTSDILPQAVADASRINLLAPSTFSTLSYNYAYADNIDIYGISLSKNVGDVSVGSDLNIRHNMPLASIAALYSPYLASGGGVLTPRSGGTGVISIAPKNGESSSATGDTLHWTINGVVALGQTALYDSASLVGELYYSNLLSLDHKNEALYKGDSSYHGIDKSTRDNSGIALNFTPLWKQVISGVDLTAPMSVNVGIHGVSPVQGGGAKDSGSYSIGIGANILNQYSVDLKYVDAFAKTKKCDSNTADGATQNPLDASERYTCYAGGYASSTGSEDRGAIYLTFKTTL